MKGRLRRLSGRLGGFAGEVDGLAPAAPSSRGSLRFLPGSEKPQVLEADLVLDLSGGTAFLQAPGKRDGYLRADPGDVAGLARALVEAQQLVGEFEKPRYVDFRAELCAHSRSRRIGCTRCLDVCPTGAITPAGDHVVIDPGVCAGCGACAGVCPTGAASYAAPPADSLLERLRVLLSRYRSAGGGEAVLLIHEVRHGEPLIDAIARQGRGLPARVLPFGVSEIGQLGLEALAGAVAFGAGRLILLLPLRKLAEGELHGLEAQLGYLRAILDGLGHPNRVESLVTDDPDELEARLWSLPRVALPVPARYLPLGGKRQLLRLAVDHLHDVAPAPLPIIPLPAGAPFGRIEVDVEGCTLCLACVSACPTAALQDNPDRPSLRFLEEACVQCGLCQNTCPERVIRLEPRLSFEPGARNAVLIKEEEPATCVRCGRAFGTRSTVERVVAALAEKHWMFQTPEQIERMRMCDDCRVVAHFAAKDNPLALGQRPRARTSEDYLAARRQAEADKV
jgi:ferredoxin